MEYIIGIDQSTQGTKALLVDTNGTLLQRCDLAHRQIIDGNGWVEHDPLEILHNIPRVVTQLLDKSGVDQSRIRGIGLSNQRETGVVWNRKTGEPLCNAIVWQCARGKDICAELEAAGLAPLVKERTGINLSAYFTAAKIAWVIRNIPGARELNEKGQLCFGTMDSWLLFRLTGGAVYQTDFSNASRTQLLNIQSLQWDAEICRAFAIRPEHLPQVCNSDAAYCQTDLLGALQRPVTLHAVMGDSHGALYGQGCHTRGMVKSTYGTGSSVMMNIGSRPISSAHLVTSLAWGIGGEIQYVLEGNINYSAAVITWLKDDLGLIQSAGACASLAEAANPRDTTYLVPAFSGLGAPYWDSGAKAALVGMTRSTGKNEIVRAAEESIAFQIRDILETMQRDSAMDVRALRVDGGPTRDRYLMQFQSDILHCRVCAASQEALSGLGVAYLAGISLGIFDKDRVFAAMDQTVYLPQMPEHTRQAKYLGWQRALQQVLHQ